MQGTSKKLLLSVLSFFKDKNISISNEKELKSTLSKEFFPEFPEFQKHENSIKKDFYDLILRKSGNRTPILKDHYNTLDIILSVSFAIETNGYSSLLKYSNWNDWNDFYLSVEDEIRDLCPIKTRDSFPLNNGVKKLIINELCSIMPFDRDYIFKKYESIHKDKPYLFFPALKAKKLLILFSGNGSHKTYNRYSWYWDEKELWDSQDTAYLFITDPDNTWYCGNEGDEDPSIYAEIINMKIKDLGIPRDSVYTIGGSMGGYAAVRYAIECELRGAISIHPQVNLSGVKKHHDREWEMKIKKAGTNFIALNDLVFHKNKLPLLYIENGAYESDLVQVNDLLEEYRKKECLVIHRKTNSLEHKTNNPSKESIDSLIHFWENLGFNDGLVG